MLSGKYHWLPLPSPMLGPSAGPREQRALSAFLAGPENRMAETAACWALGGVPFYANSPETLQIAREVQASKPVLFDDLPDGTVPRGRLTIHSQVMARARAGVAVGSRTGSGIGVRMRPGTPAEPFDWRLPVPEGRTVVDYMPITAVPHLSPIVFYGPSGCGKTQLAGGIFREYRKKLPRADGIYMNAGDFYRSFTDAIGENRAEELRGFFSKCSIIALDALDELENRPAGCTELVSILRKGEERGSLTILTAPKHPDELRGLSDTLRARMVGGLLVQVKFPEGEARRMLVHRYAEALDVVLPAAVEEFVVAEFPKPPGEVYGLMNQLCRLCDWQRNVPAVPEIREFLLQRKTRSPLTIEAIAREAAQVYGVRLADLRSKSRLKTVVSARNMAFYIARQTMNVTLNELGGYFAGRDHSTILHGISQAAAALESDESVKALHAKVMETLDRQARADG